jgi:hypothetical protein
MDPHVFIHNILSLDERAVCEAVRKQRLNLRKPPKSAEELLDTLQTQGLKQTVERLRPLIVLS